MCENELKRLHSVNIGVTLQESQTNYRTWAVNYNKDAQTLAYSGPTKVANCLADLFLETERENIQILDVGAGTGLVAIELRSIGFKYMDALDPNESMLAEAKKANLYNNYFVEFLTESPTTIPADSYDVITVCGLYGEDAHVPCDALYEMIRLVKPGGYIVIVTRKELVQFNKTYKHLEPLMDAMETNDIWKKVSRDVFPRYIFNADGIIWCYKVL